MAILAADGVPVVVPRDEARKMLAALQEGDVLLSWNFVMGYQQRWDTHMGTYGPYFVSSLMKEWRLPIAPEKFEDCLVDILRGGVSLRTTPTCSEKEDEDE